MKKLKSLFGKAREKVQDLCIRVHTLMGKAREKARGMFTCGRTLCADCRGDLAVSTIGGIIIAVVLVGLVVVAVKAFFPDFFTNMFGSMQTKLDANWK